MFFDILTWLFFGAAGLFLLLVMFAIATGSKVQRDWEFEAKFRDSTGRSIGEFDIERTYVEKKEDDFSVKTELELRHAGLTVGQHLTVHIADQVVMEESVINDGSAYFEHRGVDIGTLVPALGQSCIVRVGGAQIASGVLELD